MARLFGLHGTSKFDLKALQNAMKKANETGLKRTGFAIRASAQKSILPGGRTRFRFSRLINATVEQQRKYYSDLARWRKMGKPKGKKPVPPNAGHLESVSKPGKAPYSHTGHLKKSISFDVEMNGPDVIVGPRAQKRKGWGVLPALEYGKSMSRDSWGIWRKVKARPFMTPALERERRKLAKFWEGEFKK